MNGAAVWSLRQSVMVGSLALFAGLVTFDNLIDYETNYAFVRYVLSMDTTPPGNALMHRSIASPSLWRAAYALIIAGEGATALGFAAGATFSAAPFAFADRVLQSCQRIDGRGRRSRLSRLVLRLHGDWRRVVLDVAIAAMERPGGGLSLLSDDPGRADLCHAEGRIAMLSRRSFGGLVGAAAYVGAAVASSAPAPALDLDAIPLAEHEVAVRLAIAAAKANPFWPFGAVVIGAADRAVLAPGR